MDSTKTNLEIIKAEDMGYLGAGSFAHVRKAKYNNQIVALKIFDRQSAKESDDFFKEVQELSRSNHENIIKLFAYGLWRDKIDFFKCMVIEYAETGSLHSVLHDKKLEYTLGHSISWLLQTARAVNYLHTRGPKPTIHRDLKPLNLLLMQGGTLLKVCDFGSACNLRTMMTVNKGTPCWISPEVISEQKYNEKCDVYSYAVIIFEVLSRKKPYFNIPDANSSQIFFGVVLGKLRPLPIKNCPPILKELLTSCLDGNPNKRPSMQVILNIMERLNLIVNKTPIKPLCDNSRSNLDFKSQEHLNMSSNASAITGSRTMITSGILNDVLAENTKLKDGGNEPSYSSKLQLDPNPQQKTLTHRKSKSIGDHPVLPADELETELIKEKLKIHIEAMLYDPIEPNYQSYRSMEIFQNHKKLIDEDELLQKKIDLNKQQADQLNSSLEKIKVYKELVKQKNMILKENQRLRSILDNRNN